MSFSHGPGPLAHRNPSRNRPASISWVLLLSLAFMQSGCSSKKPDAKKAGSAGSNSTSAAASGSKTSGNNSGNPLTAPVDYLGAVSVAKKTGERMADTAPLTQAVSRFISAEGRPPNSFAEMVSEGYLDRIPEPPRGMRYVLDMQRGAVRLVPAQ